MRLMLVDDDQFLCVALAKYLEHECHSIVSRDLSVTPMFTLDGAAAALQDDDFDLVLLDLNFRNGTHGAETVKTFQSCNKKEVPVVVFTGAYFDTVETINDLRILINDHKIQGLLPKGANADKNWTGLARILSGEFFVPEDTLKLLASTSPVPPSTPAYHLGLSPREWSVAECLQQGLPDKLIADKLGISEKYVAQVLGQVYDKLGVHNRTKAALKVSAVMKSARTA